MKKNYFYSAFEGVVTKAPEMRYLPNGTSVTSVNIAVNQDYKNSAGEEVNVVYWMKVSLFGKLAEIASQYLDKGSHVLFSECLPQTDGKGNPRIWKGEDGEPHASFEWKANSMRMLGGGKKGEGQTQTQGQDIPFGVDASDEDIPF